MSDSSQSESGFSRAMEDSSLSPDAKLRLQSYVMTNGTRVLFIVGLVLLVSGVVLAASANSGLMFVAVSGSGISMLLMTTITRPLDRILAQLIDINDKLDDGFESFRHK